MSLARISWAGDLSDEDKELLNDIFNIMGMQAAVDAGLMSQEDIDKESNRIEEKYAQKQVSSD